MYFLGVEEPPLKIWSAKLLHLAIFLFLFEDEISGIDNIVSVLTCVNAVNLLFPLLKIKTIRIHTSDI